MPWPNSSRGSLPLQEHEGISILINFQSRDSPWAIGSAERGTMGKLCSCGQRLDEVCLNFPMLLLGEHLTMRLMGREVLDGPREQV